MYFDYVSARRRTRSNDEFEAIRDVFEIWSQYLQNRCVHYSYLTIMRNWFSSEDIVHFGYIALNTRTKWNKIELAMFKFLLKFLIK